MKGSILDDSGNMIEVDYASILKGMEEGRIFKVECTDEGDFIVTECCDKYFKVKLTTYEMAKLGAELFMLATLTVKR